MDRGFLQLFPPKTAAAAAAVAVNDAGRAARVTRKNTQINNELELTVKSLGEQ